MTRESINTYVRKKYGVTPDYPWKDKPMYSVYRHSDSRTWFAVVMDIKRNKLYGNDEDIVDVMNVKCDPFLIGSLIHENGIFPAYHMNKNHWVSVTLDGTVDDDKVKWLIDISFELTISRKR